MQNPNSAQGKNKLRTRRGFTVVEVMIAVAVMSLMLVSILKVLSAVRSTRDRIHNKQETQLAGPIIMDLIYSDLLSLHVLGRAKAEHLIVNDRVQYGLDADRIDFVTTGASREPVWMDGEVRRAQVCEIGYVTRPNPDDDEFLELYRREDFGVDDEPFKGGVYTFMSNRVKSFSVEVFEKDGPDEPALMEWGQPDSVEPEHRGLPASIVIRLTLENSPRLLREQLEYTTTERMTVTYERTIRFPEVLRAAEEELAYLSIPTVPSDGETGDDEGDPEGANEDGGESFTIGGGGGEGRDNRGTRTDGDRGGAKVETTATSGGLQRGGASRGGGL